MSAIPRTSIALLLTMAACSPPHYDVVIRRATIYDGTGVAPMTADLAIVGDSIVAIGDALPGKGTIEIDAHGKAVAPGFINMLSGSDASLLQDGRSESEIREGVTLEVMGEGESSGPVNDTVRKAYTALQSDFKYPINWSTLGGFLDTLVAHGVSTNVASFLGAATARIMVLKWDNRAPTPAQLDSMQTIVRVAMEEGAMGVSSALMYTPAAFAKTDELIALARAAAPYGGMYISHIRNESGELLPAIEEVIAISKAAGVRAEIYHFKAAGRDNWNKIDSAIARINAARAAGQEISADIYPYDASATGLDASMPPWVQEGGYATWAKRLRDPATRARVKREMDKPGVTWDNAYYSAGSADRVLLVGFKADSLRKYTGKTLAQVATMRHTSPEEAAMDLVARDGSRVSVVYFSMADANIENEIRQPWVSLCSDEASQAPEGLFLESHPHPRAYGAFARFLGHYVRDEKVISLAEGVRRLTWLPASNLRLSRRGKLAKGFYADVVVFDPATIADHATYDSPHQYATGVLDVFVNGKQVVANGEHTGSKPGRVVRGPGWKGSGR